MAKTKETSATELTARAPDYSGDGLAVWVNKDKNKKTYLNIKVLGGKSIPCFKVEPKKAEL